MHPSVEAVFYDFSKRFEGEIDHMYLDIKGLVTTGVGNLIDSIQSCIFFPWRVRSTHELATRAEITCEWTRIKSMKHLAKAGARAARHECYLYLDSASIDSLVVQRALSNERIMKTFFPKFSDYPVDAQLAMHSMAWAIGAGWSKKFPRCARSILDHDWMAAASECNINSTGNPGVIPRNKANQKLFRAAAVTTLPGTLTQGTF